jgi:hypothetical protein
MKVTGRTLPRVLALSFAALAASSCSRSEPSEQPTPSPVTAVSEASPSASPAPSVNALVATPTPTLVSPTETAEKEFSPLSRLKDECKSLKLRLPGKAPSGGKTKEAGMKALAAARKFKDGQALLSLCHPQYVQRAADFAVEKYDLFRRAFPATLLADDQAASDIRSALRIDDAEAFKNAFVYLEQCDVFRASFSLIAADWLPPYEVVGNQWEFARLEAPNRAVFYLEEQRRIIVLVTVKYLVKLQRDSAGIWWLYSVEKIS